MNIKKIKFTILSIALIFSISCNKEDDSLKGILDPEQTQRALVVETTGTWCPACPYGAELLMKIDYDYGSQVLPIALHAGDALSTTTSEVMETNFPTSGVPNFYVGNNDVGQSPTGAISSLISSSPPAGVGHEWKKEGSSYDITSRVKFYSESSGDYYVGCYYIQGSIDACGSLQQSGIDQIVNGCTVWPNDAVTIGAYEDPPGSQNWFWEYLITAGTTYTHEHVIAGHAGTNVWGESLGVPSAYSGEEYDFNFTINEGYGWTQNGKILTVLWKKTGNTYEFVNGYMK